MTTLEKVVLVSIAAALAIGLGYGCQPSSDVLAAAQPVVAQPIANQA